MPHATAMMDVSDGLLLDASRLAQASNCRAAIALDAFALSPAFTALRGDTRDARLFAATGGDDYALLAALPAALDPATLCLPSGTTISRIGSLETGTPGIRLSIDGRPLEAPERLGYEHDGHSASPVADRP